MKKTIIDFNEGKRIHNTIGFYEWTVIYKTLTYKNGIENNQLGEAILDNFLNIAQEILGIELTQKTNLFVFMEILENECSKYSLMTKSEIIKNLILSEQE